MDSDEWTLRRAGGRCPHSCVLPRDLGDSMEKIYEQTLLYDFYGEMLTEHQKQIYEDVVYNDMSLSEIAEECGISRQGVHDLIRRCDRILQEYEEKLHLVKKFMEAKRKLNELEALTGENVESREGQELSLEERMGRIRQIARELLREW